MIENRVQTASISVSRFNWSCKSSLISRKQVSSVKIETRVRLQSH